MITIQQLNHLIFKYVIDINKDKNNIVNSVYNQIYTPTNIKEGDLIIFPSWLEHVVPQNKSNELRITVSFNIDLL